VIELANRSHVQRARRRLTLHLLTRAGADFRVAPEALCEEREAADDRSICTEEVEGLDAHLVAAKLVAPVARAEQAGKDVLAGAALVLVDGAVDEAEQELARLERAREWREWQAQRQGEEAGGEAIEGGLDAGIAGLRVEQLLDVRRVRPGARDVLVVEDQGEGFGPDEARGGRAEDVDAEDRTQLAGAFLQEAGGVAHECEGVADQRQGEARRQLARW